MLDLLILGDSLALPHPSTRQGDDEYVTTVDETWPQRLALRGVVRTYWMRSVGGANTRETLATARHVGNYLDSSSIRVTIIQGGIADAAPRPYPLWMWPTLRKADEVARRLLGRKILERNRCLLGIWGRPWISPKAFAGNVNETVKVALGYSHDVILVALVEPGPNLQRILGSFSIEAYNDELRAIAASHDRVHFVDYVPDLHPDGHHLTSRGHENLEKALLEGVNFSR